MKKLISIAALHSVTGDCVAAEPAGTLREIAPTGTLRVGVVEAPNAGAFFVARDRPDAAVHGVTVDIGAQLARQLGIPISYDVFPNSGACTEALHRGEVDVAFMPVDALRANQVAFGPAYYLLESTYFVSGPSGITDLAGVDRPGIRVIGIANTTTIRAATRTLAHTMPTPVADVETAFRLMRSGQADAIALSRDSLKPLLADTRRLRPQVVDQFKFPSILWPHSSNEPARCLQACRALIRCSVFCCQFACSLITFLQPID
jgi:polar amino acid transport system substrate-binding protein